LGSRVRIPSSARKGQVRVLSHRNAYLRPTRADTGRQPSKPVCWHTMKRTTVKLPDDLDARLRHEADRRSITVSDLTREAIETHLGGKSGRRKLLAAGAGRSGSSDVSVRIEEILSAEVGR
jgi:hypothetical protein